MLHVVSEKAHSLCGFSGSGIVISRFTHTEACVIGTLRLREVAQSCPTLCDPMDYSPSGFSIHEIFQATVLEWVATSFSRGSSCPRDWTRVSRIVGRCFYHLSHQGSPVGTFFFVIAVQSLSRVWLFAPHGLQQARPPCPSPSPEVCSDSCPPSEWSCLITLSHSFLWSGNILWLYGQNTLCFSIHPPMDICKVSISLAMITNSTECPWTSSTMETCFLTQPGVELLHHSKDVSWKIGIRLYFKENARLYGCVCQRVCTTEPSPRSTWYTVSRDLYQPHMSSTQDHWSLSFSFQIQLVFLNLLSFLVLFSIQNAFCEECRQGFSSAPGLRDFLIIHTPITHFKFTFNCSWVY